MSKRGTRKLLFSVTKKDFIIEPYKGTGKGGQHRNKTMSCIRMRHPESGAEVIATENREQSKNKKLAFKRMIENKEFKTWLKIKSAKNALSEREINDKVDRMMEEKNLKIEYL